MKTDIHPKYYSKAKVTCSCGKSFTVGSTQEEIHVEICSSCHPFFTGEKKVIDTAGRVEKFQTRVTKKAVITRTSKTVKKAQKAKSKTQKGKLKVKS